MIKSLHAQTAIDMTEFHRQANQEELPALVEAIKKLRPVLDHFRQHEFIGVPMVRKLTVSKRFRGWHCKNENHCTFYSFAHIKGKWIEKLGFKQPGYIQVLELNGLLIICPEQIHEYVEPRPVKKMQNTWMEEAGLRYIRQGNGEYIIGYQ